MPKDLCYYCFHAMDEGAPCPHCHRDPAAPVSPDQLQPGTLLRGRFLVGHALGQDGEGIVYSARDEKTGDVLRIRELFSEDLARRRSDGSIQVLPGRESEFLEARQRLQDMAGERTEGEQRAFFEGNGTFYLARRKRAPASGRPAPIPEREEPIPPGLTRRILIWGGVVVLAVALALVWLISAGRKAADYTLPIGSGTPTAWIVPTPTPSDGSATPDPENLPIVAPTQEWQQEGTGQQDPHEGGYYEDDPYEDPWWDEGEEEWAEDRSPPPRSTITARPRPGRSKSFSGGSSSWAGWTASPHPGATTAPRKRRCGIFSAM